MEDLHVIANGKFQTGARGRRLESLFARLRAIFGNSVEISLTTRAGDGTRLTSEALSKGARWLAAAGGDGTINEVVNGYFEKGQNAYPRSTLSFLPVGSGNDWVRTLGISSDVFDVVDRLPRSTVHDVDVGLAQYQSFAGQPEARMFLNVAEAGVGGRLVAGRAEGTILLRGRMGYRLGSFALALFHPKKSLELKLDGGRTVSTGPILSLIVAGGCYFGGGMRCAPMARPDDGSFDIITLGDFSRLEIIMKIRKFFSGGHISEAKVSRYTARNLEASSDGMVYVELDGEAAGLLPATFTILPRALRLRY